MGVEFAVPLERDAAGMFVAMAIDPPSAVRREIRRTA
jgi:hypothetical protein